MYCDYLKIGKATDIQDKKNRLLYRFFEILPGALAWVTLAAIVILSFFAPAFTAIFIIIFDIYWLIKTAYLTIYFRFSFKKLRHNLDINWLEKLNALPTNNIKLNATKNWRDICHLIILPVYKEPANLISDSLNALAESRYPKERMVIIVAQEERAGEEFNRNTADELRKKYKDRFWRLEFISHPSGIVGELAGKSSNTSWAGRYAQNEIIDKLNIPYERVIISAFDADTIVFPEYFSRLTYVYLTVDNALRASYQPVPFYVNNVWEAPWFARIVAFSASFWWIILQERFEKGTTFSSHSMPFKALVDVDFWQTNIVSEDSRIFIQCFLKYNGDYRIEPLHYPVSMDANTAPSFWRTVLNVYKQQRRWAWGVESVPYYFFGFLKNKKMSWTKIIFGLRRLEDFWSWATNALIIFLLGWLPIIVGGTEFNRTILSFNLPGLTQKLMTIATIGLAATILFSIIILPPRPPRYGKFKHLGMVLQWFLFPLVTIILGALPAIDAQTRLMFGKYMGFWVTPKTRKMEPHEQAHGSVLFTAKPGGLTEGRNPAPEDPFIPYETEARCGPSRSRSGFIHG